MGKTRDFFKKIRDTKGTFREKAIAPHSSTLAWNPMDRGAWQVTVHGDTKNWTQLSTHAHCFQGTPHPLRDKD